LTAQIKELDTLNVQQETKRESLKNEIVDLTAERLRIHEEKSKVHDENQHLKEKAIIIIDN